MSSKRIITIITTLLFCIIAWHSANARAAIVTGNSAHFETTDYISLGNTDALGLFNTTSYTIEAWVRANSTTGCDTIISRFYGDAYYFGLCSGRIRYWSGGIQATDGTTTVPRFTWTHVAVTFDNGAWKTYINGEREGSGTGLAIPSDTSDSIYIGQDPVDSQYGWDGDIAEVRLWESARDQDDIRRTMHVRLDEPLPGLLAVYHLTEDAKDTIGGYDGSLNGVTFSGMEPPPQPAIVPVDTTFNTLGTTWENMATAYMPALDAGLLIGGNTPATVNWISMLNLATGDISAVDNLPVALADAAAAFNSAENQLYVFGGTTNGSNYHPSYYTLKWNGTNFNSPVTWSLPTPIRKSAAVYHQRLDTIYLFGGEATTGRVDEVYRVKQNGQFINEATALALPDGLYDSAAVYSSVTNKIYLFGGRGLFDLDRDEIYEIDIDMTGLNGSVTTLAARLPQTISDLHAVEDPHTGLIHLIGGDTSNVVQTFDPVTGEIWQTQINHDEKRRNAAVFYSRLNHHILVAGGRNTSATATVWQIPLGDGPAVSLGQWDFLQPSTSGITALDGTQDRVVIGTDGDGIYTYDAYGIDDHHALIGVGRINDVLYDVVGSRILAATQSGGGRTFDADLNATGTYAVNLIGSNTTYAVAINEVSGNTPIFGTPDGIVWRDGSGTWRTESLGSVRDLTPGPLGGTASLWATLGSGGQGIGRFSYASFHASTLLYNDCSNGSQESIVYTPNDNNVWVVSSAIVDNEGIYGTGAICRFAESTPSSVNAFTPEISNPNTGPNAVDVDVDSDGRVWVALQARDSGAPAWDEAGGLIAYESIESGASSTVRKEEMNWLDAPIASRNVADTFGWDSGFNAVAGVDERVYAGKDDGRIVTIAQRWRQLDEQNALDDLLIEHVWTVRGRLFATTDNSLHVLQPDGKTWDNVSNIAVQDVVGDASGRIWLATDSGIQLYNGDVSAFEGDAPLGQINALAIDNSGRLWIGANNGLTLFDRDRFVTRFHSGNSSLPGTVQALLAERDNDGIWIGTQNGLIRFDGVNWSQLYSSLDGLPSNDVRELAQPRDGRIAIGTYRPLTFFGVGELTFFDPTTQLLTQESLPDDFIVAPSLMTDSQGQLWAGSHVLTAEGWYSHNQTNSGLRHYFVADAASDDAGRVWFSHGTIGDGISLRGDLLPPLSDVQPTISSLSPASGSSGDVIRINGNGFGRSASAIAVTVGQRPAKVVTVNDSYIDVELDNQHTSGDVSVRVDNNRVTLEGGNNPAFCAVPVVHSFTPTGANNGMTVDVLGSNFDHNAEVQFGGGATMPLIDSWSRSAEKLTAKIQSGAANGVVTVTNPCGGSGDSADTFKYLTLSITDITLRQGINAIKLFSDKATMVQAFVDADQTLRNGDQLAVDEMRVGFSRNGILRSYTVPLDPAVPLVEGAPTDAQLADISNSVNGSPIYPDLNAMIGDGAQPRIDVSLWNNDEIVASASESNTWFLRNKPLRVLLVPILPNAHTQQDLIDLKSYVDSNLLEWQTRIWPTSRVETIWSTISYTVDDVQIESEFELDLGSTIQLYDASHSLDRARRWHNERSDKDALIALGVTADGTLAADNSAGGKAFWPDLALLNNVLQLYELDALCDVGNAVLTIVSLGALGSENGCELEIPLYVAWADGTSNRISSVFAHESGHTLGLVGPTDENGAFTDNFSHSTNDELDDGECNSDLIADPSTATYNADKTYYRQLGVYEPVVNPLNGNQLRPRLTVTTTNSYIINSTTVTITSEALTGRAKAIMSYACGRSDTRSFFEPVDAIEILAELGISSLRNFYHNLNDIVPIRSAGASRSSDAVTPIGVDGGRLYVSGLVNRAETTGELRQVEPLGDSAPLNFSLDTGWEVVQLGAGDVELGRIGVFPIFRTSVPEGEEHNDDNDLGFFGVTVILQNGVEAVELRYDDAMLDRFEAGNTPPTTVVNSPNGGTYSSGNLPIFFGGGDADGDDVSYVVEYSADNGTTWTPILFEQFNGSHFYPVSALAGSNEARIRVTATDGLNSTSAMSQPFVVANQPPRAYIQNPVNGSEFMEGSPVPLQGSADDPQGNLMFYSWTSDRDGLLGSGDDLHTPLSVGTHVISFTATSYTSNLSDTATISLTIIADYDYDGIPDAEETDGATHPLDQRDAFSDVDGDGLTYIVEKARGLNPNVADSDGDGRDDGQEVADETLPEQADDPAPANTLAVVPTAVTFSADVSQDAPPPQETITILSREVTDWEISADVDWIAASEINGDTPAGVTLALDVHKLDDGQHTGNLLIHSPSLNQTLELPLTAVISNKRSFVDVDLNGDVHIGDVQAIAHHAPTDNAQPGFDHRHDLDRDGEVNDDDLTLIADGWRNHHLCCAQDYPRAEARIFINDAPTQVEAGQTYNIDLVIENGEEIAAFETELTFTAGLFDVAGTRLNGYLSQNGRTTTELPVTEMGTFGIRVGAYTQGSQPAAGGAGQLYRISLHAINDGETNFELRHSLIAESDGTVWLDMDNVPTQVQGIGAQTSAAASAWVYSLIGAVLLLTWGVYWRRVQ